MDKVENKAAFLEVGLTIEDEDTMKKCVDYCINFNHSTSNLVSSWEDYCLTRRLHGTVVNKAHMDGFSNHLRDDGDKKGKKRSRHVSSNVNEDGTENVTLTPAHHTLDTDVIFWRIEDEDRIKTVVVEKVGCRDKTYEYFANSLPSNEFRYDVFDLEFTTDQKLPKSNIVFIAWLSKTAKYNSRLRYSRTELTMKRVLHGIEVDLQAENMEEMSLEILKARAFS